MSNTQLPAEVVARVDNEAKKFAFYNYVAAALHPEAVFDNMDTWPEQARVCYYSILHYMTRPDICWPYAEPALPAEYATRLHEVKEDKDLIRMAYECAQKERDELQAKCDRYETALKVLSNQGWAVGVKGCTWGDTEYDSESAAIGFNDCLANTIKIANEALSAGEGEKEGKEIEYMPVHPEELRKPGCPHQVPMQLLSEDQAQSNHGQSLKRLKERGGLSVTEMLAIIQRRKWESMKWDNAIKMLNDILNKEVDNG